LNVQHAVEEIVAPMVRDIRHLANRRVPPPGLSNDLIGGFPTTTNGPLNEALRQARTILLPFSRRILLVTH
jgi:hypothetical protein